MMSWNLNRHKGLRRNRAEQLSRRRTSARLQHEPLEARCLLTTFYVDDGGAADGDGTFGNPYNTIQAAADIAGPGDTVSIRGGAYREEVGFSRSGTDSAPITFEAYNGEDVLVTTTDLLTGWTQHSGDIYRTSFDSNVIGRNNVTLFVDGELMDEAHWSNLGGNVDRLNSATWATANSGSSTTITDTALRNMPADRWNGGFVWTQTTDFTVEARRIVDFTSNGSSGTLTLERPFNNAPRSGDRYLIYNALDALDAPGEWYFDEAADTLYFWAPGGVDPDTLLVEAKGARREAFDLNGRDHIHIRGIDMRGGDLDMIGSSHILLEGAHIQMPDYGFGPEGSGGTRSLIIDGSFNTIRDTEFDEVHGTAIFLEGSNNVFVNNYFHDIGYNNVNGAAFSLRSGAAENLISHNTFDRAGRAVISGAGGLRNVIQYNEFTRAALMTGDVGALYFINSSVGDLHIHHNVLHNITSFKSGGIYFDNNSTDAAVYNNISYNTPNWGAKANAPNSFILWYNNTHFNSGFVSSFLPSNSVDVTAGSRFFNNIITSFHPALLSGDAPIEQSNNYFTATSSDFVNAASGDFRLRPTSSAVNSGREIAGVTDGFTGLSPDAGALELGEEMWDFGHNFAAPRRATYQWSPLPFSNRVENPGFDADLSAWAVTSGTPTRFNGNAFNYRADALAIFGTGSVELKPGDGVEQTITGLLPNTTYEISANARLVKDLDLEVNDGVSGSFSTGSVRGENYLSGVDAGEWVRFNDVGFGTGAPRFNRIEIGTLGNSAVSVDLRLDSPTGQFIGRLNIPSRGIPWFMTTANLAAVTGTRDLYVVFQGSGGANGLFDRIRLLNTNESEGVTFGVRDFDDLGSTPSTNIGGAYWAGAPEGLTFTTGPNSDSATVFVSKQAGDLNGYVDAIALTGEAYQTVTTSSTLEATIDPLTGQAVLSNNTPNPIVFDGYAFRDPLPSLQPDTWFSLQDQEYGVSAWSEANPTPRALTELGFTSAATLNPGDSIYLGEIIDLAESLRPSLEYFNSSTGVLTEGVIRFEELDLPPLPGDYNGNSVVDAADYTVWRDQLGQSVDAFSGADGNGDGLVTTIDRNLWSQNYGRRIAAAVPDVTLIDATLNNGSFENLVGGQGAPEQTNSNRVAASFDTPGVTDTETATIAGWTIVLERYLDGASGNAFAGFDSVANRASDGQRYAFANKRSRVTVTSDPVLSHTTSVGDSFTLTFDTGSLESTNADYIARLKFGDQVRFLDSFTETIDGTGAGAAYTEGRSYMYVATEDDAGASPSVELVINAGPNMDNGQWYIDNVRLVVAPSVAVESAASAQAPTPLNASNERQTPQAAAVDLTMSGAETNEPIAMSGALIGLDQPAPLGQHTTLPTGGEPGPSLAPDDHLLLLAVSSVRQSDDQPESDPISYEEKLVDAVWLELGEAGDLLRQESDDDLLRF